MAKYRMTPKRKAALRKAQMASARKRRHGRNRRLAFAGGVTVLAATAAAAGYVNRRRGPVGGSGPTRYPPAPKGLPIGQGVAGFVGPGKATRIKIELFDTKHMMAHEAHERARKRAAAAEIRVSKIGRRKSKRRSTYWKTTKAVPKVNRFTRAAARRRRGK